MTELRQECDRLAGLAAPVRMRRFGPPQGQAVAAVAAVGTGVLAALAFLPLTEPLALVAAAMAFCIPASVALTQLRAYHPHSRFGAANVATLIRLGGVAIFAALAVEPALVSGDAAWIALGAALVLLSLDGIDGWFARREGLESAFGARFDMEVDALLILVLAVIATSIGSAERWVLGLGLARYAFVLAGWLRPRLAAPLPPSFRRKTVCVVQVAVLIALLAPAVGRPLSDALAVFAFAAVLWSFAVDVRWLLARRSP